MQSRCIMYFVRLLPAPSSVCKNEKQAQHVVKTGLQLSSHHQRGGPTPAGPRECATSEPTLAMGGLIWPARMHKQCSDQWAPKKSCCCALHRGGCRGSIKTSESQPQEEGGGLEEERTTRRRGEGLGRSRRTRPQQEGGESGPPENRSGCGGKAGS